MHHTDGKWELVETEDGELWLVAGEETEIGDPTSYFICNADDWDDELVSNGRLMMIAPKLLQLAYAGMRVNLGNKRARKTYIDLLRRVVDSMEESNYG